MKHLKKFEGFLIPKEELSGRASTSFRSKPKVSCARCCQCTCNNDPCTCTCNDENCEKCNARCCQCTCNNDPCTCSCNDNSCQKCCCN